ncbi:MAG: restriction endonuclease, partial [Dietzia cercidiphylli]
MTDGSHDRPFGPAPKIESAAEQVLGPALRTGQSPFDDELYTWTPEVAEELIRRLDGDAEEHTGEHSADSTRSPVMQALHDQLEGAPRPVVLLAAELLYIQQLPLSTVTARLKRGRIRDVLSWMDDA